MDAFRRLELDKLYRLGIMDEQHAINSADCGVSCLVVRTYTTEERKRSCIRCNSPQPARRQHKIVASLDRELQQAYDNGRFSAYRQRYAPLFAGVSCFSTGHLAVRVTAAGSAAKMWSCIRCKGGTVYSAPDDVQDEDSHYDTLRELIPNLGRAFTPSICVECGAEQQCDAPCGSCGNGARTYETVKAAFRRR